jgi:hypothetical protein
MGRMAGFNAWRTFEDDLLHRIVDIRWLFDNPQGARGDTTACRCK